MIGKRQSHVDRLLTVGQVAELLCTTERFPRRLIAERRIRFVRIGRHVRIPESAVEEFIAAGFVLIPEWGRATARHASATSGCTWRPCTTCRCALWPGRRPRVVYLGAAGEWRPGIHHAGVPVPAGSDEHRCP